MMKVSIMDLANSNCDQYMGVSNMVMIDGKPQWTMKVLRIHASLELAKNPQFVKVYKVDHWCPGPYKDVVHCSKVS